MTASTVAAVGKVGLGWAASRGPWGLEAACRSPPRPLLARTALVVVGVVLLAAAVVLRARGRRDVQRLGGEGALVAVEKRLVLAGVHF